MQGGCPPIGSAPYAQAFAKVSSRAPIDSVIPAIDFVIPAIDSVIPAQAGIQANRRRSFAFRTPNGPRTSLREAVGALRTTCSHEIAWIPACAGMTERGSGVSR